MRPLLLAPLSLSMLLPPLHTAVAQQAKGPTRPAPASAPAPAAPSGDGRGPSNGTKGLVFGVAALPTVGGFYHLSPVGSIRANLGFTLNFKPAVNAQFGIDGSYRHHLLTGDLRPFLEGGISFGYNNSISFALQGGFGMEYYITPRVSVSGALGGGLRFDNGGNAISIPLGTSALLLNVAL